jgi:formylmethanofuran dehydrogenase subunit E
MKCELCGHSFEYDEGKVYDNETFVCFQCADELVTQTINWSIKND